MHIAAALVHWKRPMDSLFFGLRSLVEVVCLFISRISRTFSPICKFSLSEFIKMQVVKMLEDLKVEVTEEGTAEEANYKKFAEFCSTTQKKKTVT